MWEFDVDYVIPNNSREHACHCEQSVVITTNYPSYESSYVTNAL